MADRDFALAAGQAFGRLRDRTPLVQNITNFVAMDLAANVLLAAGASPAMIHAEEEAGEFAGIAGALTVNIGTLSTPWIKGIKAAVQTALQDELPWVLDPVAVGATRYRREIGEALAGLSPSIIRANASEVQALAGMDGQARGVDSTTAAPDALDAAKQLAGRHKTVVLMTGETDFVTDGARVLSLDHGHSLMSRITATGCALTALCGGFLAVEPDVVTAAVGAAAVFGLAGELAGEIAEGPGSFRVALIDCLYALEPDDIAERARIVIG